MKEMVGGCCVCSDERGWPDNPLVYCDGNGCTVAVHQACYGIVSVPTGPWYCRKCECPETKGKVRCELCPSKSGALKRSDTGGWAHVVCALYIPEVRFGNVTSMEPIVLRLIPPERYNKTCYICQESGKSHRASAGACMQCNKSGCKQQFHVTCAQSLGLLCEEAGNYLDNVKYCGYCQHHYSKLKKGGNVKTIPPYKPVSHDSQSSDSSGEKENDTASKTGGSTPTHPGKSKGAGRKSSHSGTASGKSTPNSSKGSTNNTSTDKSKKNSPARRGSTASDLAPTTGSGSKNSTPAPSPQHSISGDTNTQSNINKGGSTPSNKVPPPATSPGPKVTEFPGVISSIASAVASLNAANASMTRLINQPRFELPSSAPTSVVQSPAIKTVQESVITNTDCIENKQTKKRKAIAAANAALELIVAATNEPPAPPQSMWNDSSLSSDVPMDVDKIAKKPKTDGSEQTAVNQSYNPSPAPAHSPSKPPHRHLPSPMQMPGPSGMNQPSNIRSPSQPQATLDQTVTSHIHQVQQPGRTTWGGLNVSYEIQQTDKSGLTTHSATAKDLSLGQCGIPLTGGGNMMRKKRAAMASMASAQSQPRPPATNIQSTVSPHNMSTMPNMRRPPYPPPPIYQETIKDSPPSSPSSDRPLKPKAIEPKPFPEMSNPNFHHHGNKPSTNRTSSNFSHLSMTRLDQMSFHLEEGLLTPLSVSRSPPENPRPPASAGSSCDVDGQLPLQFNNFSSYISRLVSNCSAPHMLGNELNPDSGVAARLQEQLTAELAAHAAGSIVSSQLVPPPLINKASQGITGGSRSSGAQSLDQLLERQWEQGSQFLMEQAQHFDIASLLSCLHQLRTENVRLEEHVTTLLQRRDHLLAVNARLAIPLNTVATAPPEPPRCQRENGSQMRAPPVPVRNDNMAANMAAERSHQMMVRDVQQKPS